MERKPVRFVRNAVVRPSRRFRAVSTASVKCPNCGFRRLIDTGQGTESATYVPGQDGYDKADYYQKCSRCNEEIGIRKL